MADLVVLLAQVPEITSVQGFEVRSARAASPGHLLAVGSLTVPSSVDPVDEVLRPSVAPGARPDTMPGGVCSYKTALLIIFRSARNTQGDAEPKRILCLTSANFSFVSQKAERERVLVRRLRRRLMLDGIKPNRSTEEIESGLHVFTQTQSLTYITLARRFQRAAVCARGSAVHGEMSNSDEETTNNMIPAGSTIAENTPRLRIGIFSFSYGDTESR
ncbi:hypothetical protein RRG08_019000 [Elysia crispata]|uniref:Uncharacterized protein n=1 Tax=Elysia crispata TaxID=231223 RepID=A0AAE1A4W1_9GAST|nr:hypothetical protein RRG08_019000 [Elysia crispata]